MSRPLRLFLCWLCLSVALIGLLRDVAAMDGWRDHGLFYYAPRLILSGNNAYDWGRMKSEWRADGKPLGVDPGTTMSGFVNPPSMALLTLPPSLMPPRFAYRSLDAWNLLALAVCIVCLLIAAGSAWPPEIRILFAAYCCWLPAVRSVLLLGQSTLLICACLAGGLLALSRRKEAIGGMLIGLALAKFTLALPFCAILLYRRNWRASAAAIGTFVLINLALSLPFGLQNTVQAYRTVVARETRPGSSYDALTTDPRWMPDTLVHAQRLLVLVIGHKRKAVTAANLIVCGIVITALAVALRRRPEEEKRSITPLEAAALILASILLFYHRNYDLAVLILIVYGLIDHGLRTSSNRTYVWRFAFFLSLLLSYLVPGGLEFAFTPLGGADARCLITCLLLVILFGMLVFLIDRDRRKAREIDQTGLEHTKIGQFAGG